MALTFLPSEYIFQPDETPATQANTSGIGVRSDSQIGKNLILEQRGCRNRAEHQTTSV